MWRQSRHWWLKPPLTMPVPQTRSIGVSWDLQFGQVISSSVVSISPTSEWYGRLFDPAAESCQTLTTPSRWGKSDGDPGPAVDENPDGSHDH